MGTTAIAWGLAALFGVVAAGLVARLRQLTVEVGEAHIGAEKLEGELRATREQLERELGKLRRKSDELAELRKRHDKLRKRKEGEGASTRPAGNSAGATERDLEEARQARDRARQDAAALQNQLDALRAAQAEASERAAEAPTVETLSVEDAERLRADMEDAAEAARAAKAEVAEHEKMVGRLRKRLAAQETAYVSLRGELEAKKDRLTTQNEELERLRALKVTWVDEGAAEGTDVGAESTAES